MITNQWDHNINYLVSSVWSEATINRERNNRVLLYRKSRRIQWILTCLNTSVLEIVDIFCISESSGLRSPRLSTERAVQGGVVVLGRAARERLLTKAKFLTVTSVVKKQMDRIKIALLPCLSMILTLQITFWVNFDHFLQHFGWTNR